MKMPEKRIVMTQELRNELVALTSQMKALSKNLSGLYAFNRIPLNKLGNAAKSFAQTMGSSETVILLHDDTFTGNAKNGFILTTNRFYSKRLWTQASSIKIVDITSVDYMPRGSGGAHMMQIHSKTDEPLNAHIGYVGAGNKEATVQLVEQIVYALQASIGMSASAERSKNGNSQPATVRCNGCGATVQTSTICKFCRQLA